MMMMMMMMRLSVSGARGSDTERQAAGSSPSQRRASDGRRSHVNRCQLVGRAPRRPCRAAEPRRDVDRCCDDDDAEDICCERRTAAAVCQKMLFGESAAFTCRRTGVSE